MVLQATGIGVSVDSVPRVEYGHQAIDHSSLWEKMEKSLLQLLDLALQDLSS